MPKIGVQKIQKNAKNWCTKIQKNWCTKNAKNWLPERKVELNYQLDQLPNFTKYLTKYLEMQILQARKIPS